ncbi:hypothetical protein PLANPX_2479 [Lacipirellula parvula]|uniref:Uncharacterized protein n=1 Tax=Lacipirellula parvula TaxID=2650471 RepID=A0A5K7XAB9_9BACT|nr:hypothetical protein PLANPX_2479 [Lacipirellula parvula]
MAWSMKSPADWRPKLIASRMPSMLVDCNGLLDEGCYA